MSDLTDEEIIATRKLQGLNDDLFKEGTDINAGSINKIMERLNFLIIDLKNTKKVNEIITEEGKLNLAKDIETVLNMLKEKDKEIEKLKKHNKEAVTEVFYRKNMWCDRNCKKCIKQYFESKAEKE